MASSITAHACFLNRYIWMGCCALFWFSVPMESQAQVPDRVRHYLYDSTMPHGMVGQRRSLIRPQLVGYSQPVKIVAPEGAQLPFSPMVRFRVISNLLFKPGMSVGSVYRLKVTHIPGHPGREVFPSIEIIDRLYPAGRQGDVLSCSDSHSDRRFAPGNGWQARNAGGLS